MNTNDVEDLPIQGDPSGHEDERSVEGPETKHSIISSEIDSFFAQFAPNQRYHPIFDKFGPEHVSQFLEISRERDAATRRQLSSDRIFMFSYFAVIVGIFIFLTIFLLPDNEEIFVNIVTGIGFFTAGGLGGYGWHAYRSGNREREP